VRNTTRKTTETASTPSARILARFRHEVRRLQRDAQALLVGTAQTPSGTKRNSRQTLIDGVRLRTRRLWTGAGSQASNPVASRAELFLAALEYQALSQIRTLLGRLDIPSRRDLDALTRRVRRLEDLLETKKDPSTGIRGADQRRRTMRNTQPPPTQGTTRRSRSLGT